MAALRIVRSTLRVQHLKRGTPGQLPIWAARQQNDLAHHPTQLGVGAQREAVPSNFFREPDAGCPKPFL